MTTKNLDEIVLDEDVRERIRPLFEQATASGEVSFEHDWQWQAYYDFLKLSCDVENNVKETFSCKYDIHKDDTFFSCYNDFFNELNFEIVPTAIKSMRYYQHDERFFEDFYNAMRYYSLFDEHKITPPHDWNKNNHLWLQLQEYISKAIIFRYSIPNACRELGLLYPSKPTELYDGGESDNQIKKKRMFFNYYFESRLSEEAKELLLSQMMAIYKDDDFLGLSCSIFDLLRNPEYQLIGSNVVQEVIEYITLTTEIPNYTIIKKVGEGSGRIAYKAWYETDKCYVAVKVAKKDASDDSSNRTAQEERYGKEELAEREGSHARLLTHKNIARYFGRGELPDGRSYIIEEYVEGVTLRDVIKNKGPARTSERYISINPFILELVASDLLFGLGYLHAEGYVHRDLKPENILVPYDFPIQNRVMQHNDKKPALQVKITDLELARSLREGDQESHAFGARAYQAPEVLSGKRYTQAADVFSLGLVLYELFTRQHPFAIQKADTNDKKRIAANITRECNYPGIQATIAQNDEIPDDYKSVIAVCLQYDPNERFRDAGEVLAHLQKIKRADQTRRKRKKNWRIAGVLGTAAAIAYAAWQTPLYFHEREVARNKATAEETYKLAEEIEADGKSRERKDNYSFESARFLYRVASNLDHTHRKAKERVCTRDAAVLAENVVLKEGRNAGIEEIYLFDSLSKGILFQNKGEATDLIFPNLEDTIELCERTRTMDDHPSPELFLRLAQLYEVKGEYGKAVRHMRRYVKLSEVEDADKETLKENDLMLAKLLEKNGNLREAYDLGDDTLRARVALEMYRRGIKVYEDNRGAQRKKIKVDLLREAIESSVRAIEEAENPENKKKKRRKDEEHKSEKELSALYYMYGVARLVQYQQGEPDYPGKYALDKEKRKEFPQSKKKKRKDHYSPKPLEDALAALLNAAVLDPNQNHIYYGLAAVFHEMGNQYEKERAYQRGVEIDIDRKMQQEDIKLYKEVFPLEVSRDIFSFRVTTEGELCNPFFVFDWYEQQYNSDLRILCTPASFFGNLDAGPTNEARISGFWFESNNEDAGSIYSHSEYTTAVGTAWEETLYDTTILNKRILIDDTEFLAPVKEGDKIRFDDKY